LTAAIALEHVYAEIAGQPVLEDINLVVNEREFFAIIGPNGGGKTTLVKLMLGLLQPKKGSVRVFGGTARENRKILGYVPQFHTFDFHYPITLEEMVLSGRLGNKSRVFTRYTKEDHRITEEVLRTLGISDLSGREISSSR
jgi:zinc transport system ATP-binding protein